MLFLSFVLLLPLQADDELKGYSLPYNKQGLSGRNYGLLDDVRYKVYKDELHFGLQKFNYYWRDAETTHLLSSEQPACPTGHTLFPHDDIQKKKLGINNFHCYKSSFIHKWDRLLKQNAKYKMQAAVVLWTAPTMYTDKGCEGFYFPLQKRYLKEGCYPTSEHYDDYEDWVRFTAHRFGKYIDHYIVWNEADLLNWADSSTTKDSKSEMLDDLSYHMKRSFSIYTHLLKTTITAVEELDQQCVGTEKVCKPLVYVSMTGDWYSRKVMTKVKKDGEVDIRWRSMNLLDYIWQELGLEYAWSIAIHPYGEVYGKSNHSLVFSTLKELSAYQKQKVKNRKAYNRSWLSYPQSRLFASEQNIGGKVKADDWKAKARFICESYDVAMKRPEIIATTHNHFQDNVHRNSSAPSLHTMLPKTVGEKLKQAERFETYRAYESTREDNWYQDSTHYCCKEFSIGCMNR